MPVYAYECRSCNERFERKQKMSDPAVTECPACGGEVRKLMFVPSIAFVGAGFHVNDYARSNGSGSSKAASQPT